MTEVTCVITPQDCLRRALRVNWYLDMRGATKWTALVCMLLMVWTAAAEPMHHHASKASADGCSLCLVAHSATPTPSSNNAKPVLISLGFLQATQVHAPTYLEVFDLAIRGPPAL